MNTSRRGTGRKNQNVPRESSGQDISQFVYRRSKEGLVEIDDDDDEVQDLTDQFAFAEEDVQPNPVKRRKKHLIFEDSDDDLDEIEGMDEDERRQMKEAIRQSKLQLEVEAKRRAAYATIDVKSISESGPAKSCRGEDNHTYSQDETQDCLSVQSSPTSSFVEKQQDERAESPDLFGTPRSSMEEPENIADKSCSPSKSPFKSRTIFSSDDLKSSLDKNIVINLTPVKRQLDSNSKNKLKLKKKESSRDQDKKAETTSKLESNGQKEDSSAAVESKKRKLYLGDEDDDTEESGREFVVKEPKKKQKTMIEDVLHVKHLKKDDKQKGNNLDPQHIIVKDDDEDDDDDDEGSMQDARKVEKRSVSTTKMKKSRTTRLERAYSKPRLSIKTIKDAMKARLYFAPPGIDPKTYTYAIVRMMDHTRKRIYRAQRKSLNFIKWGKPIVVGPRETNSLDARKEKKKSNMGQASTSAFTSLEAPAIERKRSLRSAQASIAVPPIKIESVSASAREGPSKVRKDYIESDESDDDLTKPVFGEPASKPKSWKEEPETFGENVITSTEYKEKSVDMSSTSKADSKNVASSSFTGVQDISENMETKQKEVDENEGECMNGKRGRMNERLENRQEGSGLESKTKTDGRSPSKLKENSSNQNAEISWIRQDNDTREKHKEKRRTVVSELIDKEGEEEEIDSSIETGINKSKKHPKKALIQDVEEEGEEDSQGPLAKLGIEVKDEDEVERDDDLLTNTESKPGASLTNVAAKSGYLKVERTPTKTPRVQRSMSSAARRAAEAAEKRMKTSSVQSIQPSQEVTPSNEDSKIECPICFSKFYKEDIETHAANCDEGKPNSNPTSFYPGKSTSSSESQKSIGSPADSEDTKNQGDFRLKNLQVMVTRSPEAHSRLLEQKSYSACKARRNLSLNKATRSAVGSADNQASESRRSRRSIDMTMDDDNNPKIKKEGSTDEDSQSPSWFSTTARF